MSTRSVRIATGHPATSEAAQIILTSGGHAVDAAIASVLAACVAEPMLASLAGGGHALIQSPTHAIACLDCFTHTPIDRHLGSLDFYPIIGNFGTDHQEFHVGLASVATPGLLAGLDALHERFATLPKHILIEPACRLARSGVPLNALQHHTLEILEPIVRASPGAARWAGLADPDAPLPLPGTTITNPAFADFLETWAQEGARAFYEGEPGQALVAACRQRGGHIRAQDLQRYRAQWRRPLHWRYRHAKIWSNPPPALGGLMLALATTHLEQTLTPHVPLGSVDHIRAMIEAMALSDRDRQALEHPDPTDQPGTLRQRLKRLLEQHAQTRKGTTHISIEDSKGWGVSMTLSNGEGAGQVLEGSGIMLNNMLGEEDLNRGGFHGWPTNQRLASMMTPTILQTDSKHRYLLGSGGSNRIRTALLQVLAHVVDFGLPLEQAIQAPRLHLEQDHLSIELAREWRPETQDWLLTHHKNATPWPSRSLFFGGVHAVGPHEACADSRREGLGLKLDLDPEDKHDS